MTAGGAAMNACSSGGGVGIASADLKRKVISEVALEYGLDLFEQHDSGIALAREGLDDLQKAVDALRAFPSTWTVLLEGHCPGLPEENNEIRESVGEEAADLCKEQLQLSGVTHAIVCAGLGSRDGLGMRVRMSLVEPEKPPSPVVAPRDMSPDPPHADVVTEVDEVKPEEEQQEEKRKEEHREKLVDPVPDFDPEVVPAAMDPAQPQDEDRAKDEPPDKPVELAKRESQEKWNVLLDSVAQPAEKKEAQVDAEVDDLPIPDTSKMSPGEQLAALEELLLRALPPTGINFDANHADIMEKNKHMIHRLSVVLQAFPDLGIQCAGHAKGRPGDNNLAKRALSQDRARSVQDALRAEGVENGIVCIGFGSALGRGNCVRVHALAAGEAESEDAELRILGWNTGSLSPEQERASLNQLLKEALETGSFEPNKANIRPEAALVVRRTAWVLKAFPNWAIRCEGHAKGQPPDDNEAKHHLSQVRAESFRAAVEAQGVTNSISCFGLGCSQGMGMKVLMFAADQERDIEIPDTSGWSEEQRRAELTRLLAMALERGVDFEPNKHDIPPSALGVIRSVAQILKAFPDAVVRCEGHAKGKPQDNNDAKRRLSQARAEAVRAAVRLEGVKNNIMCIGEGSSQGRGTVVRMVAMSPEELKAQDILIPDATGMSNEEKESLVNSLLEKALNTNIDFEPNSHAVPMSAMQAARNVALILKAFPSFLIRCEGHAKGQPQENNSAKTKLSHLRAEAFKAAVRSEGAPAEIRCKGRGSELGLGVRVRMFVLDPSEAARDFIEIPTTDGLSKEARATVLNECLAKALTKGITFEPNSIEIEATVSETILDISRVLKSFSEVAVRIEGHTKGKPADNNGAKMRLSQARAEAVKTALEKAGVQNQMHCYGQGCSHGLGMCVRMIAAEDSGDGGDVAVRAETPATASPGPDGTLSAAAAAAAAAAA
eukprot:CAMPEP_0115591650 /NCGR_PEP_ID=MMETSP0272-20121206/10385_1 /TAXON_ID=71861 /ORGANISM="Scrippsiella trochoidea, Strain CCMP3099" /LENGTH=946 /DNA_ID=CAMNT_0003026875 /DNA_START=73 /DNA_END=2909 /DNA_ORIENTATION=-